MEVVHAIGLARISEGVPMYGGVIVYNMNNVALGFGVTAKSTEEIRALDAAVWLDEVRHA